jgi:non-haem Fe2+, alpha-ketoglutarate-dependent halogenase
MVGSLTAEQYDAYWRDGYLAPLPAVAPDAAGACLDAIARFEATTGQVARLAIKRKGHLKLKALYALISATPVLDAVESLIGPDILCWGSALFIKDAGESGHIAWHQDSHYFETAPDDVVSAWIALAPSTPANGPVRVVPGSHRGPVRAHRTSPPDSTNLIGSRDEVEGDVDDRATVPLLLEQGQMSLHHANLVHGSAPNVSDMRRCGFVIRYVSPRATPRGQQTATLVRGQDRLGRFGVDPVPT